MEGALRQRWQLDRGLIRNFLDSWVWIKTNVILCHGQREGAGQEWKSAYKAKNILPSRTKVNRSGDTLSISKKVFQVDFPCPSWWFSHHFHKVKPRKSTGEVESEFETPGALTTHKTVHNWEHSNYPWASEHPGGCLQLTRQTEQIWAREMLLHNPSKVLVGRWW